MRGRWAGALALLAAFLVGSVIAACGGPGVATRTTADRATPTGTTPSRASLRPPPRHLAAGTVAWVNGITISRASYQHWMQAGVTTAAHQHPGRPELTILPLWPPAYADCLAQVNARIAAAVDASTAEKVKLCAQNFAKLNHFVLGFLITAQWYRSYAAALGIDPTAAELKQGFRSFYHDNFRTPAAYQRYLRAHGETAADIMWRVRVNLTVAALEQRIAPGVSPAVATRRLSAKVRSIYRAHTVCALAVRMNDCRRPRS